MSARQFGIQAIRNGRSVGAVYTATPQRGRMRRIIIASTLLLFALPLSAQDSGGVPKPRPDLRDSTRRAPLPPTSRPSPRPVLDSGVSAVARLTSTPFVRMDYSEAIDILKGVHGLAFVHFDESDVVRHHLVQRIIRAYDEHKTRLAEEQIPLLPESKASSVSPADAAVLVDTHQGDEHAETQGEPDQHSTDPLPPTPPSSRRCGARR